RRVLFRSHLVTTRCGDATWAGSVQLASGEQRGQADLLRVNCPLLMALSRGVDPTRSEAHGVTGSVSTPRGPTWQPRRATGRRRAPVQLGGQPSGRGRLSGASHVCN